MIAIPSLNPEEKRNPAWFRLPGEPAKWYSRFEVYLSMGPERTIHVAYLKVREYREESSSGMWKPNAGAISSWSATAKMWNWVARAEAWDDYNRGLLLQRNEERRMEEREVRLKMITQQLHNVDIAILAAQLDSLGVEEARTLLPTLRLLFRDMLEQHRTDLEPLPVYDDNRQQLELIPFTSDELAVAVTQLTVDADWAKGSTGLARRLVDKEAGE